MNYHLMIDHWFNAGFVDMAEKVAPNQNHYILTFSPPAKYIKFEGVYAPLGSSLLDATISSLKSEDRLYIHWLQDALLPIIKLVPVNVSIYIMFWGGDWVSQTKGFDEFLHDHKTARLVKGWHARNTYAQLSLNPKSWVRHFRKRQFLRKEHHANLRRGTEVRRYVLAKASFFCHWNERDFEEVVGAYNARPVYLPFFYESQLHKILLDDKAPKGVAKTVWLGNSDTFTNNHLDAIAALKKFNTEPIKIVAPLSYGFHEYADFITQRGKEIFGSKWNSLLDFVPIDDYIALQKETDVVVMFHNRTQAGFNIFSFLKMGKKVYLKSQSTIYQFLMAHGILVYDANTISSLSFEQFIAPLAHEVKTQNSKLISDLFSTEKMEKNYRTLLSANP